MRCRNHRPIFMILANAPPIRCNIDEGFKIRKCGQRRHGFQCQLPSLADAGCAVVTSGPSQTPVHAKPLSHRTFGCPDRFVIQGTTGERMIVGYAQSVLSRHVHSGLIAQRGMQHWNAPDLNRPHDAGDGTGPSHSTHEQGHEHTRPDPPFRRSRTRERRHGTQDKVQSVYYERM